MTPISFLFCYGGSLKARMEILHRFRQRSWLIALLFFCLCVALKLNGSSVGMWEQELSERKASKGLLLFEPQPIRTDEWLVWARAARSSSLRKRAVGVSRSPLPHSCTAALTSCSVFTHQRKFHSCI